MRRAFTMVELIVVIVIIGLIAAFSIPSFTKAINRARARDAINNLNIIHSAAMMYKARNNGLIPSGMTLATINDAAAGLGLNIIANGATYTCTGIISCSAKGADNIFTATVNLGVALGTANPSCTSTTSGYCP